MAGKKKSNPVAIVTGSGRRLGRHIAVALARHGYDIVINYRNSGDKAMATMKKISSLGARSIAIRADVSDRSDVNEMISKVITEFGRIDLLVNNSAVFSESSFLDTTESTWDRTIDINLKGVFLCSQAVAPVMLKQKHGKIINIASLGGIQAWKKHVPYSVSKAGVIMLTRIMAKALAPSIHVNAIAPGTIIIEGEEDPGIRHVPVNTIPLNRYGRPEDITDAVLYLAITAHYITGQVIVIDGGRSIVQ